MKEQAHPARLLSAAIAALPGVGTAWASTQAAWRFFHHDAVTPAGLAAPLRQAVRQELAVRRSPYTLALLDGSKGDYRRHPAQTDRRTFCNPGEAGSALTSVLAVDAHTGDPLGPLEVELEAADGVQTTRADGPQPAVHHVEQVAPLMDAAAAWDLPRRPVFVIDREYDSLEHYRAWQAADRLFLVRADTVRRLRWAGESTRLDQTAVVLDRPAWKHKADGTRKRVPGPPLPRRLVVVELREADGRVVSRWQLFTNVPADVDASQVALGYSWRWRIETCQADSTSSDRWCGPPGARYDRCRRDA